MQCTSLERPPNSRNAASRYYLPVEFSNCYLLKCSHANFILIFSWKGHHDFCMLKQFSWIVCCYFSVQMTEQLVKWVTLMESNVQRESSHFCTFTFLLPIPSVISWLTDQLQVASFLRVCLFSKFLKLLTVLIWNAENGSMLCILCQP